jgi:hypothetical protein
MSSASASSIALLMNRQEGRNVFTIATPAAALALASP